MIQCYVYFFNSSENNTIHKPNKTIITDINIAIPTEKYVEIPPPIVAPSGISPLPKILQIAETLPNIDKSTLLCLIVVAFTLI